MAVVVETAAFSDEFPEVSSHRGNRALYTASTTGGEAEGTDFFVLSGKCSVLVMSDAPPKSALLIALLKHKHCVERTFEKSSQKWYICRERHPLLQCGCRTEGSVGASPLLSKHSYFAA